MRSALFLLVVFLIPAAAQNAGDAPVTLSKAISIAVDRNYVVKRATNDIEAQQASVLSAYGNFLPTVSLNSSWSGGQQYFNGVALGESDIRSFNNSLSASVTLFDGFNNTSNLSAATSLAEGKEYDLKRTTQSVIAYTTQLYYDVLRTRRLLDQAKEVVAYSRQQLDRVKETARLGSASIVNVYQQQAQVGADELSLVQAQNNYDVANANLSAYLVMSIGHEPEYADAAIPLEIDSLDFVEQRQRIADVSSLTQEAFDRRPDYESGKLTLSAAGSGVTSARAGYFPTISARLSYALNGRTVLDNAGGAPRIAPSIDALGNVTYRVIGYSSATAYQSEFSNFTDSKSLNWSLSLSLPLFSGFRTNETVQRAQVQRRSAELAVQELERTIQVQVKSAALQLQAAQKTYDAAVRSLQYQEQNLRVNQEKYNVGSGTLLDLLLAQNNYNSALTSKINAVYSYLNAKAQLGLAMGIVQQ